MEAIPDGDILALADPDDRDGDGIRGRAGMVEDAATGEKRVGRFGWKSQHASLLVFAADAYVNEMGITSDIFQKEGLGNISAEKAGMIPCQPSTSPEDVRDRRTGMRGIDNFANYLKLLAPPPRGNITEASVRGGAVFSDIGCATCHRPQLQTGPSDNPLFHRKPVDLFSDLLLHDIGTGDGIEQGDAKDNEVRTPSLWGLRFRRPLLHDGSASTPDQAILMHSGESAAVTERYRQLPATQKRELLEFLRSL